MCNGAPVIAIYMLVFNIQQLRLVSVCLCSSLFSSCDWLLIVHACMCSIFSSCHWLLIVHACVQYSIAVIGCLLCVPAASSCGLCTYAGSGDCFAL